VQAILSSEPQGEGLAADFLSEIKGVSYDTIIENAREGSVRLRETSETVAIRVLDPVLLLAGKIRNAVEIEQNQPDRPRQDVKHVAMLGLCVPHFLEDVRIQAVDREQQRSILSKYIATLAALKNTYSGRQFEAQHPDVIHWQEVIPSRIRQMAFDRDVQNSLRQLTGMSQSRGIGI
jgi:hypothetical protein